MIPSTPSGGSPPLPDISVATDLLRSTCWYTDTCRRRRNAVASQNWVSMCRLLSISACAIGVDLNLKVQHAMTS